MNKFKVLLADLADAELELAKEYRSVAERQAAEHDVANLCQTLAKECDAHLLWLGKMASEIGGSITHTAPPTSRSVPIAAIIRETSRLLGHRPEAGLLLIRDLRQLYLRVQRVDIGWVLVTQILKSEGLQRDLKEAVPLHGETTIQAKWLETRLKVTIPQVILVPKVEVKTKSTTHK